MATTNANIIFHPLISTIQKVVLYETKTRLYLVGSNNRETRFRLLVVDRTHTDSLVIEENPKEFNSIEIRRFLTTLSGSAPKILSAYGILGFVRFLEGYYLILVTKRKCCSHIGMHLVYTIKDTIMVRVNEPTTPRTSQSLEERYKRMFQNIDLRSNFYFSYSYDLTRTLQYNEAMPRFVGANVNIEDDEPLPDWRTLTNNVLRKDERVNYAFRSQSRQRFVWNAYLLKAMRGIMLKDWLLEVTHGYVSQSCISVFGRRVNVCLIARRSTKFAGTRFLKRGANLQGDVANEVETEQIVIDGKRMCSFTQMRGSVPSHWSQDISKIVPKPPIQLDISDPYAQTPSRHLERLHFHYGAPVIILNLVKKREKRKHESILSKELISSIRYLNQFLAPPHRMKYIHFDMARKSRAAGGNVMDMLANIAENIVQQTGMFLKSHHTTHTLQQGIVRTNCVDCLDRTNSAQFAIGKCVLGHQLARLGFTKCTQLEFDSDCVTMLENLYEEHGDTLALQYGGSQLVHRIKTYRKTAAWASQGNDIMQTLSRYYSNTFSDTEKQHCINLFLGYYIPSKDRMLKHPPLWEMQSDYYMHNICKTPSRLVSRLITDWVSGKVRESLPMSCSDTHKCVRELFRVHSNDLEMIDAHSCYHHSFKLTDFTEHIAFEISQLAMRYMPTYRTNYSPFLRQIQDRRSRQNPSMTGQSSTGSTNSSNSSSSEGDDNNSSTDEDLNCCSASEAMNKSMLAGNSRGAVARAAHNNTELDNVYGHAIRQQPTKTDLSTYRRYVQMHKFLNNMTVHHGAVREETAKVYGVDFSLPLSKYHGVKLLEHAPLAPTVTQASLAIYENYCLIPQRMRQHRDKVGCQVLQDYMAIRA